MHVPNIFPATLDFQIPCFVIQMNGNKGYGVQKFDETQQNNLERFSNRKIIANPEVFGSMYDADFLDRFNRQPAIVPFAVINDYVVCAKRLNFRSRLDFYAEMLFIWSIREEKFVAVIDYNTSQSAGNECDFEKKPVVCQGFTRRELFISDNYHRIIIFDGNNVSFICQDSVDANTSNENQTVGILKTDMGRVLCISRQGKICQYDLNLKKVGSFAQVENGDEYGESNDIILHDLGDSVFDYSAYCTINKIILLNNGDFACGCRDGYLKILRSDDLTCIAEIYAFSSDVQESFDVQESSDDQDSSYEHDQSVCLLLRQLPNGDILAFYDDNYDLRDFENSSHTMLIVDSVEYSVKEMEIKGPDRINNICITCLGDIVMQTQDNTDHKIMNSLKFFRYAELKPNPSIELQHEVEENQLLEQEEQPSQNLTM